MADPPSYEETISASREKGNFWNGDTKQPHRSSIREEVGASRCQHVGALTSKILPQIRERAKSGLGRTTLLLLPSDQAETSKRGDLVGFPEDDRPIMVQLEGRYDGTQFWTQQAALDLLRDQMLTAVAGEMPAPALEEPVSERPVPQQKSSFWDRKQSKAPDPKPVAKAPSPPVKVEVRLEQINFRTETEYGLYETLRGRGVLMTVDVR